MKRLVSLMAFLCACGAKPAATTAPTGGGAEATSVVPDVVFDDLDQEQRVEFMKQKVMPVMKPIFQNHDAKRYAEFGCQTCHGEQAKDGHFDMPNPGLPKLDFGDMAKFKKQDLLWMKDQVLPTMGKLLRKELYSAQNPNGFSCTSCHTEVSK